MPNDDIYEGREQTLVKHLILRRYLERFAHIVGHNWNSITYIDCFAGPWNARSEAFEDSSFSIALEELRRARDTHALKGRSLSLRCFFLEKDREAYGRLKRFADGVHDAEVELRNTSFEDSIDHILAFIRKDRQTFPFIFIDPTGWTGFRLRTIAPLLRLNPGEVLVNFMTGHILRFLQEEGSRQGFVDLFGSDRVMTAVEGLSGIDREDAIVSEYMDAVRRTGNFISVLSAMVLHPEKDRTHFHLIYGTRHPKGIEVFKDTEKSTMPEMLRVRSDAQRRKEKERSGQADLFDLLGGSAPVDSKHYDQLRERYLGERRMAVLALVRQRRQVPYDDVWSVALSKPLVWEGDLKEWITEWQREGLIAIRGLQGKERVPQRQKGHILVG